MRGQNAGGGMRVRADKVCEVDLARFVRARGKWGKKSRKKLACGVCVGLEVELRLRVK